MDRDNARSDAPLQQPESGLPARAGLCRAGGASAGKWIGLCGELGAKGSVLPLLVGLGLDELSMSAPAIPATKSRLAQLDSRACRQLLNQAMQCRTSLEVEHLLAQFRMRQQDVPLVSAECITLNSDWRSKEEVLKGMTDNLLIGRPLSLSA